MPRYLQITVRIPDEASVQEARDYCKAELESMGGTRHPDDPLFRGVRVTQIRSIRFKTDAEVDLRRKADRRVHNKG